MASDFGARARRLGIVAGLAMLVPMTAQAQDSVVLYTADGLEDFYKEVLPAFERQNNLKVEMVTAGSGAVVNRATIEKDSPKADVIVTLPPFVQAADAGGILQPYRSPADAHIPAGRKAADGTWETFVNNYFVFAVGPAAKARPETFADLLKPAYAGEVAYSNPATAGDGMGVVILTTTLMGENNAFDYLQKLERNVKFHTKGTGYLDVLLSREEIAVANGDLQMDVDDNVNGGLDLKPIFLAPKPGAQPVTFELPYVVGLVNHAPHADAGRKLIDYLLSAPVQAKVTDVFGLPARDDVKPAGKKAEAVLAAVKSVKVVPIDWNAVRAHQAAWEKRWKDQVVADSGKQTAVVKATQ